MSAHDLKKNNDVHDKSFIINTATFCKKKIQLAGVTFMQNKWLLITKWLLTITNDYDY